MTKKYSLTETNTVFTIRSLSDLKQITPGCTFDACDVEHRYLQYFDSEEDALNALARYSSDITVHESYVIRGNDLLLTEYAVYVEDDENDDIDLVRAADFGDCSGSYRRSIKILGSYCTWSPSDGWIVLADEDEDDEIEDDESEE